MPDESIEKIAEREALLDKEIADRQKLKEAYRLVREDLARQGANGKKPILEPESADALWAFDGSKSPSSEKEYGENTRIVRLAISKMTDDYTIRELRRLLRAQGHHIQMTAIATVLNRLKKTGEIKVRVPGRGRRPTLFKF
jgi:hypothetical protein